MMNAKVFVETTILVSCSVHAVSRELGVELVHRFHDISSALFDVLRGRVEERLGITTSTVEEEARSVLAKAVMNEISVKTRSEPLKRSTYFQLYGAILDICSDNLTRSIAFLLREPVPEHERNRLFQRVSDFYRRMQALGRRIDTDTMVRQLTYLAPKRLRRQAEQIYRAQFEKGEKSILRLVRKPVDETDRLILAEAIYLLCRYRADQKDFALYLASTDQHFSPAITNGEDRTLTEEIEKTFGIVCDWPNKILERLKNKGIS